MMTPYRYLFLHCTITGGEKGSLEQLSTLFMNFWWWLLTGSMRLSGMTKIESAASVHSHPLHLSARNTVLYNSFQFMDTSQIMAVHLIAAFVLPELNWT